MLVIIGDEAGAALSGRGEGLSGTREAAPPHFTAARTANLEM
ncbi:MULTISPECIES: hypothetical protein [Streptomyces]|jgi:hypothetical protein|nr:MULTISPECIES: hypothetical protein [Streptomyces]